MKRIEPQTEYHAKKKLIASALVEVAKAIPGATFRIDEEDGRPRDLQLGEVDFYISYDERTHRFSFSMGCIDSKLKNEHGRATQNFSCSSLHPRESSPEITVSADKPLEQIIKDFNRRFLPEFTRLAALLVAYRDNNDAYHIGKDEAAKALALKANGSVYVSRHSSNDVPRVIFPGGSAEVRSADSIKFDFTVGSVGQAARIAALLNKFKAEDEAKEEA